jgi:sulfide:quinone oxidoreductase
MLGWRKPRQIMRDLARLQKHGITYVQAEVSRIDAANRAVTINGDARPYDRLVLAMGADVAPEAIPGLSVASHHPY